MDAELLRHYLDSEIATEYGADADELSAHWGFEEGTEGDDILVIGGYGTIVRSLLEGIDVRLSSPVTAVAHDDRGVRLTVGGTEETFDRVIVTLPLGVLKAGTVTFDPPLPAAKQDAVDHIGFGLLDKLWLLFDEPFWTEESLMWTVAGDGYGEFFNLQPLAGAPVLLALAGGDKARHFETLTDDEVIDAAVASLQRLVDGGF